MGKKRSHFTDAITRIAAYFSADSASCVSSARKLRRFTNYLDLQLRENTLPVDTCHLVAKFRTEKISNSNGLTVLDFYCGVWISGTMVEFGLIDTMISKMELAMSRFGS